MTITGRARYLAIFAIVVLCAWLVVILAGSHLASGQALDTLSLKREVTPASGILGKVEFEVTLTLTADAALCEKKVVRRPGDIVLVLDHSPSMNDPVDSSSSSKKIDALKAAAKTFLSKVDLTKDLVGIVEFDTTADVAHPISNDQSSLQRAIDAIQIGSGTAIDQGVVMAHREFKTGRARKEASQIIVLITDGRQSVGAQSAPADAARAAKSDGIRIITIGLGNDADQDTLRGMASQPSDYYYAPQASDLDRIYTTIAETVTQPLGATDIVLEHTYDTTALEIVPNSIVPPSVIQGDKISWAVKEVLDQPYVLTYRLRPRAAGSYTIDRGDLIRYNRCGVEARQITFPAALPVSVLLPPTNTPPPTPTLTPTPKPTFTPRPTPLPTATPTDIERIQKYATSVICEAAWWPLCPFLLLVLFFIWWFWRLLKEMSRPAHERNVCRLIPWLLLPLALILLWLIISNLTGVFCAARESVYFWRIDPDQNDGRIYVTDREGLRPAREFAALGGNGCVGCHAVSSTSHRIAAVAYGGSGPIRLYRLDGKPLDIPEVRGSYVAWSPDGTKLAISTDERDVVIMDTEAKTVSKLVGASDPSIAEMMPAWSCDGQQIAFVRGTVSRNAWTMDGPCDIYVVPALGGTAVPVAGASGDGFNYYPAYSPDGLWLAFTRHVSGTTTYSAPEAEIFIMPAGGGQRIRLSANDAPNGTPLKNVSNSWPTWSLKGEWLAFNSKRDDKAYDIFVTRVDANGNSGPALSVNGASGKGIFEHLPNWGEPPKVDPWPAILGLWPWLIPFLLVLLAWWLCRKLKPQRRGQIVKRKPVRFQPGALTAVSLAPLWQVAPTLIVGVGGTGRWVLTYVKKALRDGGVGTLPPDVRFVLLDSSEREETNLFMDAEGKAMGVEFAGVSLTPDEMLLMGQNLSSIIEQGGAFADAALAGWFPYDEYRRLTIQERNLAAGTGGRRPLARAGLIDKVRQGAQATASQEQAAVTASNDASHLWDALVKGTQEVLDGKLVRIIVVGSLAGGMGGALLDLAYLARRAGMLGIPPDGTVHLEGYFTAPGAFRDVAQNYARLQVNAMAAGRELERFQLSEGFPFPMHYLAVSGAPSEPDRAYLGQSCTWRLFDDVTLFGGAGNAEHGEGKSSDPWATALASMADVIVFRMDRAVNAGGTADYRAGVRSDVNNKQDATGKAAVSSAGSYVYRLPLLDILEIVQTRWARKLFHVFLNGSVEGVEVSFDPAQAQMPVAADEYARQFVMAEHEAGEAPRGMSVAGYLATGGEILARDVLEFAGDDGRPFSEYLQHALGLILNGSETSRDPLERRAPRLGYALAFAQAVQSHLLNALQRARAYQSSAPADDGGRSWWKQLWVRLGGGKASQKDWQAAADMIQSWAAITGRALESIQPVRNLLIGVEAHGDQPAIRGLYDELVLRQARAEQRRKQMDQVAVRRYLWSRPADPDKDPADPQNQQDLADEWYQQAEQQLPSYLNRFYWSIEPDGHVQLAVITFTEAQKAIALDGSKPASVQRLADEIMGMAFHVTQDWARNTTLRNVLATQLSSKYIDPARILVERVWPIATPHLLHAPDVNGALDGKHIATAGLPDAVQKDAYLAAISQVLAELGTTRSRVNTFLDPCSTNIVTATDRTAMTLVREHNLMPMANLPEFQDAWQTYSRNAGRQTDALVESARLAAVFAAERQALEYERRLESTQVVNQDFRLLHPLIVLALARPDLTELYALAFAAGWVETRTGTPWLRLPVQGGEYELALRGRAAATGGFDPRVSGLLRMTSGSSDDEGMISKLRVALSNPDEATKAAWRSFIGRYRYTQMEAVKYVCELGHEMKPGAKFCGKCGRGPAASVVQQPPRGPWRPPFEGEQQDVQDLGAMAALAAYRRLAPDDWDDLIMPRPRLAS